MTSPWVLHCKEYATTHGCSYKQALSQAKDSYQASKALKRDDQQIPAETPQPPKQRVKKIKLEADQTQPVIEMEEVKPKRRRQTKKSPLVK